MSHHDCPNHGTPFRSNSTGDDSQGGSSYSRQPEMDLPDRQQNNGFLAEAPPHDPFYHSIPQQLHNHAVQNVWVAPTPGHGQPEGHREDMPPPVGGVARPGRVQDPYRIEMAHQGIVDYHPQPFADPVFVFPDVGHVCGVPVQHQEKPVALARPSEA